MTTEARLVMASHHPLNGWPMLVTLVARYPVRVHAEVMTYRRLAISNDFSLNAASARAIPYNVYAGGCDWRHIEYGSAHKGMSSGEPLTGWRRRVCQSVSAVLMHANRLGGSVMVAAGAHKEEPNRLMSTWAMIDVVMTGTPWALGNLVRERTASEASLAIQPLGRAIQGIVEQAREEAVTREIHSPFSEDPIVSAGIAARVTYRRQSDDEPAGVSDKRARKLRAAGHMTPFEHQARAVLTDARPHDWRDGCHLGWRTQRARLERNDMLRSWPRL